MSVEVNFVIHPSQAFERSHRAKDVAAAIQHTHLTLAIDVKGWLLIKPHKVERGALKFFATLIAAFETYFAEASKHIFYQQKVDYSTFWRAFAAALHDNFVDPAWIKIMQNFLLNNIALHLP